MRGSLVADTQVPRWETTWASCGTAPTCGYEWFGRDGRGYGPLLGAPALSTRGQRRRDVDGRLDVGLVVVVLGDDESGREDADRVSVGGNRGYRSGSRHVRQAWLT